MPQGASESDQNAVEPMLEKMEANNAKPEKALMGSDEKVVNCANKDVELVAPTTGKEKGKLGLEECEFDDENRIIKYPCGKKPLHKKFSEGKGRAVFARLKIKNQKTKKVMDQVRNNPRKQILIGDYPAAVCDAVMESGAAHNNQMQQCLSDDKKLKKLELIILDLLQDKLQRKAG